MNETSKQRMKSKFGWFIGMVAVLLIGFSGSVGNSATFEVQVVDFQFVPATVTIQAGDTVNWVWQANGHSTTSGTNCTSNGLWDSGIQNAPFEFSFTFDNPGTYPYFCIPHCTIGMVGTVVVSEQPPPPPTGITINVSPTSLTFADVAVGQTSEQTVTITNDAGSTGTLTGTVGSLSTPFSVVSGEGDFSLEPGQSLPVVVQFAPTEEGTSSATLDITHNAANEESPISVGINGTTFADGGLENPIPKPIMKAGPPVGLMPLASGLTAPNWGITAPGDNTRLFVVDQVGTLWAIDLSSGNKTVFADLSSLLVPLGAFGPGTFDERGFLGLAFHPQYRSNGLLYTYTSEPVNGEADFSTLPEDTEPNHQSVIREWRVPDPMQPASVVDPASSRVVLRIDQPQFNHNAGALNFGRDKMLYIALGDGGAADDQGPGHSEQGNGQDPSNILGNILRIDPTQTTSANGQYGIPMDNPFIPEGMGPYGGQAGCADGTCDEIFAWGFRNPFRFSFDMCTGHLYAGDVGQNDIEEVDIVLPGGNYGWRIKEGSFCFNPNGDAEGFVTAEQDCPTAGLIGPVAQYDHDEGTAIVGGFVYRGNALPAFRGRYIFGEYNRPDATETEPTGHGRIFFLNRRDLARDRFIRRSCIKEMRFAEQEELGLYLLGFGRDAAGEIYVLGNMTGIPFEETGVVWKIVPRNTVKPPEPVPPEPVPPNGPGY